MPETSIIIRTLNEEKHLNNLLKSIQEQNYKNYEVIVVDSGSTDNTLKIARDHNVKILEIDQRDFTFGYSLNVGCEATEGKYLVFASAHVLPVNNDWLSNLVASFQNDDVAMVYGRQIGHTSSKFSEKMDFKRLFRDSSNNSNLPIYYANNANSAIRRDLWVKRKFDEYLFGLEDIEWARHITEEGSIVHYEPNAIVSHIHTEKWYQILNRYRREAIAAVRIGLPNPPQVRINLLWFPIRIMDDLFNSFPNWSFGRLREIFLFRYYQFKGSRVGWKQGKDIDFKREKSNIFNPISNHSVIIKKRNSAEFEVIPLRAMKPGDVLIKVDYVGICRTDLEILEGTLGYYRDGMASYPIVPGHEFSGTIVKIGSNNKFQERFKIGQKVVGECILSRDSSNRREVGVINYDGAYSEYVVMPGDAIHKIPEDIDLKTASMTEPLAVVLRAIRRVKNRFSTDTKVAIMGAGPIGNLCAQVLTLDGYNVSVFDKNLERLKVLKKVTSNVFTSISRLDRFDIIIEATGSKEVLERIIKESGNDSTLLLLGFPYGIIEYNFEDLAGFEKVFVGSVGGDREDFIEALKLLPKLDMELFTQKVIPLEDFKKAWDVHRTSKYLKVILNV